MASALLAIFGQTTPAQDRVVVTGTAPVAATHGEDPTSSGSTVELDDRSSARQTLPGVISEIPGTHVTRTGGEGAFVGLAIRGSDHAHTSVLIGDVPLGGPDTGGFDLSLIPLDGFERVEVYRGGAPVWIGDGAIGGVLRLIPRRANATRLIGRAGAASFGTWWAGAEARLSQDNLRGTIAGGGISSRSDYLYLDDAGTRFIPDDDTDRSRMNADVTGGHGLLHAEWDVSDAGRLSLAVLGLHRTQGEPGPGVAPALQSRRARTRFFGALTYLHEDVVGDFAYRLQIVAGGGWENDRFEDKLAEIGLSREDTDDHVLNGHGRLAGSVELTPWLQTTAVLTARHDRYQPSNVFAVPGDQPTSRTTLGAAIEARLHGSLLGVDLEARPSARLTYSTAVRAAVPFGQPEPDERDVLAPTLRLGLLAAPVRWLSIVGSASTGLRVPTVVELFGNRGTLLANPSLEPERSKTGDLGVVLKKRLGDVEGQLEVRAFGLWIDDLIRYRRSSQFTAIAENVELGRILGGEAGASITWSRHVFVAANATFLQSEDHRGRALPLRPSWVLYARPEGRTGPIVEGWIDDLRLFVDVQHTSSNFVDAANLVEEPERTWLGAGLHVDLFGRRLACALTVHDLLDARGSDLLGFPLSGRRFELTLTYSEDLQ